MPRVPFELSQGLNVVNPGISEGVNVKMYPNMQAEQMVDSGNKLVSAGANIKIMSDQIMLNRAEADAKSYDSEIADFLRVKLYDSKTGYMATSGKRTLDIKEQTDKEVNDYTKEFISKIKDPFTAQIVSRSANVRKQQAFQAIDSHALSQGKIYEASASVARVDALNNDLAALYANNGDPIQITSTKISRDNELVSLALKQGLVDKNGEVDRKNPLFIKSMATVQTNLVRDVVNNAIVQDNPRKAREFLEENKDGIDQTVYNQLSNLVRTGSVKKESLDIFSSMQGRSPEDQKKELNVLYSKGLSADTYDATMSRIDKGEADGIQQRQQWRNSSLDAGLKWFSQNQNKSIADLPPQMKINLIQSGNYGTLENAMAKGGVQTNPETYSMLLNAMTSDRSTFLKTNLMDFQGQLSQQHLLSFMEKQAGLKAGDQKIVDSTNTLEQGMASIAANLKAINIDTTPKPGSDAAKKLAEFMSKYSQALDAATVTKGSPLTEREGKDIGLYLTKELFDTDSWFSISKPRYKIKGSAETWIAAKYNNIPIAERNLIEREIGEKFTSEQAKQREVERLYSLRNN